MSNSNWLPWIQQQLLAQDILTQTPEMPKPYEPNYESWLSVLNQFTINKNTVLIGHSCGAGFLVRWLTESDIRVNKIILVAPWLDPLDTIKMFSGFLTGVNLTDKTINGITVFNSDDDDETVQKTVEVIRESNPDIKYQEFHNYGHFVTKHMGTKEFPELLKESIS